MEEFDASRSGSANSIPKLIGDNLRIDAMIGRGGMGTVYRATHLGLDRVVAVKIINPEVAANADISQRFAREARLMAKLRHPRAAMIYDSGTLPDGRLYIVMEYVEGVTLAEVLKREGRLNYRRAVEIAVSVCDVLSEAHSIGIIHRDLKPANIMLNNQGVFVLDFGIAKMLNSDSTESLKLSMTGNALIGTPYYMSPEQCLGNPVEPRSDLYSLGAVMFEMLSGRPPFDEEVFSAVIIKHAMVEPPRVEELSKDVPPALSAVVNKMLAKKPEDRPANAAATRLLLEASVSDTTSPSFNSATQPNTSPENAVTQILPVATNPQTGKTASDLPPVQRAKSNRPYVLAAAAAGLFILIAAVTIGALMLLNSHSPNVAVSNSQNDYPNYNSAYSNSNSTYGTDHTAHTMPMGEDFAKNSQPGDEKADSTSMPILSAEQADEVISMITQTTEHRADGMQIIKTPKDTALVCLHNVIEAGKTHLFTVERPNPNSQWEITARISLDTPEFRSPNWTFEPQDVDGDGYEEVIFNAENVESKARRTLIYVPRTRQNYWIVATKDGSGKIFSKKLSPNAETANGAPFRAALEQTVQSR